MTDRNKPRVTTHADDCWDWGQTHYECAVRKIKELQAEADRLLDERDALIAERDALRESVVRPRAER